MATLSSFTFLTLNGFYKGLDEDISWHKHGSEEEEFSRTSLEAENILLFGRTTYEMMAGFWPTPMALESMPAVAEGMNRSEKIVVSRTLKKATWNNTRVVGKNWIEEIKKLKQGNKNITLLGSGSILTQLAAEGLLDYCSFMIDPVAIGKGSTVFAQLEKPLSMTLLDTRVFNSGVVLVSYKVS